MARAAQHERGELDRSPRAPVVVALVAVEALVGLAALYRSTLPAAASAAIALAVGMWVVGQDVGELYTGQATDPNSAPLIVLAAPAMYSAAYRADGLLVGTPAGYVARRAVSVPR